MRCPRCGNENSEQNRFCGMCGASLLAIPAATPAQPKPPEAAAPPVPTSSAPARPHVVEAPRTATPVAEATPSISGPSFLGLGEPAPRKSSPGRRATLSIDPHSTPGSNLDYLLDDEEQPRHWGVGRIFVILLALALAVGFGYLRWRKAGLGFLTKKPAAVAQNSTDSTSPAASTPSITIEPQPASPPAASIQPATDASAPGATPPASSATPNPNPSTPAASTASTGDASRPADSAPSAPEKPATPPEKDSGTATKEPAETPAPKAATAPPKEALPKPSPAKPSDTIAEAQKYLYGRGGATQDCDRGLRLLKPLANQGNSKAMVEMGALYSAKHFLELRLDTFSTTKAFVHVTSALAVKKKLLRGSKSEVEVRGLTLMLRPLWARLPSAGARCQRSAGGESQRLTRPYRGYRRGLCRRENGRRAR